MLKASTEEEHRKLWLRSGRQGNTSCPTGSPSMSSLLGRVRSPSDGQSLSSSSLQQHQGRRPFGDVPSWVTGRDANLLFAAPPAAAKTLAVSQLLRYGHGCFLWLELVAELRDGTLRLLFITLEKQPLQGCRLAQATLTNRLLIMAVIFKKFHPCCIPGCLKALMFHQPQRDPPASKGSFPLGDSRTVILLQSLFPAQSPSYRESHCQSLSLLFHLLNSPFCFPLVPLHSAVPSHASTPTCPVWCSRHGLHFFFSLPSLRKAFESLEDGEGGSVLRPSSFCTAAATSWCLLAAPVLLKPFSNLRHLLCPSRSPCLLFGVCHCILFLFPLTKVRQTGLTGLAGARYPVGAFLSSSTSSFQSLF